MRFDGMFLFGFGIVLICVTDLQLALKEHDNKQIYMARQHLLDIRNIYAVLADLIQKNIAKVCCLIFWLLLLTDGCVAASSEEQ
jgi:hypothetical protein